MTPNPPSRQTRTLAVVVVAVGVGLGGVAFALFGNQSPNTTTPAAPSPPTSLAPQTRTQTVTETTMAARPRCRDAPRVTVSDVGLDANGLILTADFATPCRDGDVLTGSAVVLSAAQGTRDFASGRFDLDTDPIVMPPAGTAHRTLIYPIGTYWRGPDVVRRTAMDVGVAGASHDNVATTHDGSSTLTAKSGADPGHGTLEGTADAALRELADVDRGDVGTNLANYWVPQISAKRRGIRADGIVYGNVDILRNHFQLRLRYPNVKLVSSTDWTTFDGPGYWISVVGQPYYDGRAANSWCDQNGIGVDDCFAKLISSAIGPDGTTMLRR